MKRVLLTGASGFIGSSLLYHLAQQHRDWQFVCIQSWRHKGNALRVYPTYEQFHDRITMVTHDLTGPLPMASLGYFDYVLNLASESHVDRSLADPVAFIENNVSSTLNVLDYAHKSQAKLVVQFSTDEVFGPGGGIRRPLDRHNPSSPYAASKACQEMIALSYARSYGLPVVITNSSNVIGPGQDAEKYPAKLWEAITSGSEIDIHVDAETGRPGARIYNPLPNVCSAVGFILECTSAPGTRFLIPGGSRRDNLELAETIARIMGRELRYRLVKVNGLRPGYDTEYAYLDGSLLADLGWRAPTSLDEYLEAILAPEPEHVHQHGWVSEAEEPEPSSNGWPVESA